MNGQSQNCYSFLLKMLHIFPYVICNIHNCNRTRWSFRWKRQITIIPWCVTPSVLVILFVDTLWNTSKCVVKWKRQEKVKKHTIYSPKREWKYHKNDILLVTYSCSISEMATFHQISWLHSIKKSGFLGIIQIELKMNNANSTQSNGERDKLRRYLVWLCEKTFFFLCWEPTKLTVIVFFFFYLIKYERKKIVLSKHLKTVKYFWYSWNSDSTSIKLIKR